ncbi:MAG: amino acid adenylation domain-containing protein [Clostridiales bacterium]|nr:amino acid adenylation domain-containing protein [Clostridiales bacterium]
MEKNAIEFLENAAAKFPNNVACAHGKAAYTYSELQSKAKGIASQLIKICSPSDPVLLFMEKSCEALFGLWGVVCAGCCYAVVDTALPAHRIRTIISTLDAKCIITKANHAPMLRSLGFAGQILDADSMLGGAVSSDDEHRLEEIKESICDVDPLYVMFTSGSAGTPKGVVVSHRAVIDFISHFTQLFDIQADDVVGNQAPWDFDVSVKDIYSAARTGAALEIIPKKKFSFPKELIDLLEEKKVTTLIWAVSALCIMSSRNAFEYKKPAAINKVIFSGEVMPIKQFRIWREAYPDAVFANVYGPTEITCNCLYYIVEKNFTGEALPIGKPFPNRRVFLLDEEGSLVEKTDADKIGEICVSGSSVGLGYYNNKAATDANFKQNPLNKRFAERIYCTGDLAYYNQDGMMCFYSRKDFQIKHMGHRIELEEIERNADAASGIVRACCAYDGKNIICFYEGGTGKKELARELRQKLPQYMIPAMLEQVETMPVTKNGKIDRKKLLDNLSKKRGPSRA